MMDTMLIVLYIGCGLYALWIFLSQRRSDKLLNNKLLFTNECPPQKCKDPQGFKDYMLPKTLILGVGLLLFGGAFVLENSLGGNQAWLSVALIVLPLALFAWFITAQHKAAERFWKK